MTACQRKNWRLPPDEGRSEERRYIKECQFVVRWKEREKTGEECLQEVRDMVSLAEIG